MFLVDSIWAYTPTKPGCTPQGVFTRPNSCPFGPVLPVTLALRPVLRMHVPVPARLGLYAVKTWLYAAGRVCMFLLEPIQSCMPSKPGCMPLGMCVRPLLCPFGTVENLGYTTRFSHERARSSPVGPVGPKNLALHPV